jgi:hypothetical protein
MALYPAAVKRLIPPGENDPRITPRVAILHVDAGNAYDLHDYFATRSGGIESHFHIAKDGKVFQYRDTAYQADANMDANDFAVSIETQGYGAGEWTAAQLASIKALLLWLKATHGIPLVTCPRWDGAGVGYHILFMDEWAGGPRACPGPDRIKQFNDVLVPWMGSPVEEDDMADYAAQLNRIEQALTGLRSEESGRYKYYASKFGQVLTAVAAVESLNAQELADAIPDAIAQQVVDALSARLAKEV